MSVDVIDVMANWRHERFVVSPNWAHDDPGHLIVLTDVNFWCDHITDLVSWCQTHDAKISGMTVEIPTDEILSMFVLRWS